MILKNRIRNFAKGLRNSGHHCITLIKNILWSLFIISLSKKKTFIV